MSQSYFAIEQDEQPGVWIPRDIKRNKGRRIKTEEFAAGIWSFCIIRDAEELPLTVTGSGPMVPDIVWHEHFLLVKTEIAEALRLVVDPPEFADIPAVVSGGPMTLIYPIYRISCLDFERSENIEVFDDSAGSELAGKVRHIGKMRIRSQYVRGPGFFRCAEYPILMIVSERVRDLVLSRGWTGVRFTAVTD